MSRSIPELERVCVFCGSNFGKDPAYREAARTLGDTLVERGIGLVYGGGNVGLMGVIADRVLAQGGEVIGVIPQSLVDREVAHQGLTELHVVDSMHARKAKLYALGDAVIAMPGGVGTFEELFESFTWNQLQLHFRPAGLLNVAGYYDPLIAMLDRAVDQGFVRAPHREALVVSESGDDLLEQLAAVARRGGAQWMRPKSEEEL